MDSPAEELRPLLFSIAYRMTSSVTEAEDLVQEAFLRYAVAEDVESPRAWLTSVVTRLAIDHLRSARARRETYVGPWLPEPLLTDPAPGPAEQAEEADSLSLAFLVVLETLSPLERAVFVLREVLDYPYSEIAPIVGKSEDNVRQIATRSRRHVDARRPRFEAPRELRAELTDRFLEATRTGDVDGLVGMLAEDAVVYSDGGGRVTAARKPVEGASKIARFMTNIARPSGGAAGVTARPAEVNGGPGVLLVGPDGGPVGVMVVEVAGERIQTVRLVVNPDKLRHLTAG